MKKFYLLLLLIPIIMGSCQTTYKYSYNESTARYLQPEMMGFITPTVADLNVSNTRISFVMTFPNTLTGSDFYNTNESPKIQSLKSFAISEAVKKYNADVIVGPTFDIETTENMDSVIVKVIGYPATYCNFRKATKEDVEILNFASKAEGPIIVPTSNTGNPTSKVAAPRF